MFAGSSTINQIDKIMFCIAPPTRHDLESIQSPYAASILSQIGRRYSPTCTCLLLALILEAFVTYLTVELTKLDGIYYFNC